MFNWLATQMVSHSVWHGSHHSVTFAYPLGSNRLLAPLLSAIFENRSMIPF